MSNEEYRRNEEEPESSEASEVSEGDEKPVSGEREEQPFDPIVDGMPEADIVDEEPAALEAELAIAREERDSYLDQMKRMKAEMDNLRKRMERERERTVQMAAEKLVRELLPVIDNLERALDSEGDIRNGVQATRDQLLKTLEGAGLSPVESDGAHFDPNFHEAVMGQPSEEHEEDTIIQTLEKGYLLNGRAVRTAKVIVAK